MKYLKAGLILFFSLGAGASIRLPATDNFKEIESCQKHIFQKLKTNTDALILGYRHGCESGAPQSLTSQIVELKKAGFTDLVLEVINQKEESYLAGLLDMALDGGHFAKDSIDAKFGTGFVEMVQKFKSSGFKITFGDSKHGQLWTEAFDKRNEHFTSILDQMIASHHKPILLIGACHVGPVQNLLKAIGHLTEALDASSETGQIENAGLSYPTQCRGLDEKSWNQTYAKPI